MRPQYAGRGTLAMLAMLIATSSPLLANTRTGSYSLPYGNASIGGSIEAYGTMTNSSTARNSSGRVSGWIHLLNINREAGRIEASGTQSYGSGNGALTVRIGGVTVWTQSLSASGSRTYNTLLSLPTPPPLTVMAGPIPVSVSTAAGVGASLSLQWALVVPTLSAGVNGNTQAWGYGSATASAGIPGYNVGVQADLQFANHRLNYGMTATPTALNGYLGYVLTPITLTMTAFANAWPLHYTTTLASYTQGSYSTGNLLQN